MKRVTDANNNRVKNVGDPVDDGNAVNKKYINQTINPQISDSVLPPNSGNVLFTKMSSELQ
jgi:hypothetical protein